MENQKSEFGTMGRSELKVDFHSAQELYIIRTIQKHSVLVLEKGIAVIGNVKLRGRANRMANRTIFKAEFSRVLC